MKKILVYVLAHLISISLFTLIFGAFAFFLFWIVVGLVVFITWSSPVILPSILVVTRLSLAMGFFIGIFFINSKEGKEWADGFVEDWRISR